MASERVETGPVRIGDDWAGVFIRGDDAAGYAVSLSALAATASDDEPFDDYLRKKAARRLAELLMSCHEPCNARALYASPVAPAWRTIETAPKDGTGILIAGGTYTYDAGISDAPYEHTGVTIAYWRKGAWCGGYGSEYDGEYWHKPTLWMPLPPLPVAPREEP